MKKSAEENPYESGPGVEDEFNRTDSYYYNSDHVEQEKRMQQQKLELQTEMVALEDKMLKRSEEDTKLIGLLKYLSISIIIILAIIFICCIILLASINNSNKNNNNAAVLLIRQDSSHYFTESDYRSLNKDDINAKLYSRLEDLKNLRGRNDGKFHFKLCYLFNNKEEEKCCLEFRQYSHPEEVLTPTSHVEGFELISLPTSSNNNFTVVNFGGLRSDSRSKTFMDGAIGEELWWLAVAARGPFLADGTFPGPLGLNVTVVELYVIL